MHLNFVRQRAIADLGAACEQHHISILPYYPLASGLLTGKYSRDQRPPSGSRMDLYPGATSKVLSPRNLDRVDAGTAFAQGRNRSLLELGIGWLLSHPSVASVLAGATKPEQVFANVGASAWRLTKAEMLEASALGAG